MQRARATIHGIAAGGAGVGRLPDGRVVFVQRTAPGDDVELRITEEHGRFARAALVQLLRPGPGRREAPCPHHARCGSCPLEHLTYPDQLIAKANIVSDSLQRIGRVRIEIPPVVPSPLEFQYRNRLSFTLLRIAPGTVVAGFHQLDRPDRIIDITGACLLPEPVISATWDALRQHWGPSADRLPSGRKLRLTLRATAAGETSLLIEGGRGRGMPEELLEDVPSLSAIWMRSTPNEPAHFVAGQSTLFEQWQDDTLEVSGTVFLQVNRQAAAGLEEYVLTLVGDVTNKRVIDAYCGIGVLAHRIAARGAQVVGIERDASAIQEARRRAAENSEFLEGAVEDLLPAALPADLAIANPPRSGLAEAACKALLAQPVGRLIYVSCDPATMARDVARLSLRFSVRSVRCFDLFPQTAHVETVLEMVCDSLSR